MKKLNESQLEAVNFGYGALLVVAGAGTGKTSLITQRITHLISNHHVKPEKILALTFTEKAGREMVERLDESMPLGYFEPKIGTYHSFCQEILKAEGQELGLNTSFNLITQPEQWILLRKEIYNFSLKTLRPKNNPGKYLNDLLKLISKCVDENISSKEIYQYSLGLEEPEERNKWSDIACIMEGYRDIKLKNSLMDFGDLITFVLQLFQEKPYILKKYQERFQHVLIDEFQDTNYAQYEIVKLLCPPVTLKNRSLVVVGDDSQSIYKFRGAAISNILEFKKDYVNPKIVTLNENYRSSQEILNLSYQVIQNNNPYTLESKLGISKKLNSNKPSPSKKSLIQVVELPNLDTEVSWVISQIQKLLREDPEISYKDIAILCRANSYLDPFILELKKAQIPYQVWGSRGLYDQEEVRLVICLLNLLINTSNNNNLFRCLFIESLKINSEIIYKLTNLHKDKKTLLWDECVSYQIDKNLTKFVNTVLEFQRKLPKLLPSDLIFNFLNQIDYLEKYTSEDNIQNDLAIKNLNLFLDRVKQIEKTMFAEKGLSPNLIEFLDYFNLLIEAGDNPAQAEIEDVDTINLTTVHSSKGLEFEAVFMPCLINGRFPSQDRRSGFDIPDELVVNKEILPEEDYFLQEERRLFYVGVTRAKKYLNLSYALSYGKRERAKSTFLEECGIVPLKISEVDKSEDLQMSLFENNSSYRNRVVTLEQEFQPTALSYTAISNYKNCPLKYKFQFVLGFPTKQSKALSFGNTIHETLKEYHQKKLDREVELNELLDIYKNKFQPYGYDDRDNQIDYYFSGIEMLKRYHEKYGKLDFKHVVIEKNFKFDLNGVRLSGKIDRIDRLEDGSYEVIDYKTGEAKSEKEIRSDDQLTLYALAAKKFFGYQNVKLSYFYVEHDAKITTSRNEEDFNRLEKEAKEIFKKISNQEFQASPSAKNCNFCDFKDICPSAYKD